MKMKNKNEGKWYPEVGTRDLENEMAVVMG